MSEKTSKKSEDLVPSQCHIQCYFIIFSNPNQSLYGIIWRCYQQDSAWNPPLAPPRWSIYFFLIQNCNNFPCVYRRYFRIHSWMRDAHKLDANGTFAWNNYREKLHSIMKLAVYQIFSRWFNLCWIFIPHTHPHPQVWEEFVNERSGLVIDNFSTCNFEIAHLSLCVTSNASTRYYVLQGHLPTYPPTHISTHSEF